MITCIGHVRCNQNQPVDSCSDNMSSDRRSSAELLMLGSEQNGSWPFADRRCLHYVVSVECLTPQVDPSGVHLRKDNDVWLAMDDKVSLVYGGPFPIIQVPGQHFHPAHPFGLCVRR